MFKKNKSKEFLGRLLTMVIAVVLIFIIFFLINYFSTLADSKIVFVAGHKIRAELAQSDEEKILGLSKRDNLASNVGMIFIYDEYNIPSFWMKDMLFPIDIIWIKDDMVVGFEKNVMHPDSDNEKLLHYQPKTFVNYVLEVNSGFVAEKGIKIGDKVEFIF